MNVSGQSVNNVYKDKDMSCVKIWRYRVVSYKGGTIRIGCHKLPLHGMPAVYEEVIGEKFNGKRDEGAGCGR